MANQSYDAIVVGSGISGGWAAKELTEKGLKVLLLERGPNVEHVKDYKTATLPPWDQYFGHYHTAGNPGRNELDENQEIYYPAIMKAIVETGYKGFVSHEFIPKSEDKLAALGQAVQVCDV